MPDKDTNPYQDLPYLDNVHQALGTNGYVNKLKQPLRNAVNANRTNVQGMQELIAMLEDTLVFIKQNTVVKKKRVYKKRDEIAKEEYDLP